MATVRSTALLLSLALVSTFGSAGCKKRVPPDSESEPPREDPAATGTPPIAKDPESLKLPLGVTVIDPVLVRRDWGSCKALDWPSGIRITCNASGTTQDLSVRASAKGGAPEAGEKKNEVIVPVLPALLESMGDIVVPPLFKEDLVKRPANLTQSFEAGEAPMRFEPKVTFEIDHDHTITSGDVEGKDVPASTVLRVHGNELRSAAEHGLLFAGETVGDGPRPAPHSAIFLGHATLSMYVVGTAKRIRDADWIAVEEGEWLDSGKECGGYHGADKTKSVSLPLWFERAIVVLRERRTGRELSRKVFDGSKACRTGYDVVTEATVKNYVARTTMFAWVTSELKSKR